MCQSVSPVLKVTEIQRKGPSSAVAKAERQPELMTRGTAGLGPREALLTIMGGRGE